MQHKVRVHIPPKSQIVYKDCCSSKAATMLSSSRQSYDKVNQILLILLLSPFILFILSYQHRQKCQFELYIFVSSFSLDSFIKRGRITPPEVQLSSPLRLNLGYTFCSYCDGRISTTAISMSKNIEDFDIEINEDGDEDEEEEYTDELFLFDDNDEEEEEYEEEEENDDDTIQSLWLLGDDDDDVDEGNSSKEPVYEMNTDHDDNDASHKKKSKINPISNEQIKGEQQKSSSASKSSVITLENVDLPSRGVGRQGINITILHQVNYDQTLYTKQYIKEYYDLRISLLQDYCSINGDISVPFRYNVTLDDYDTSGNVSGSYEIHLGRWLHRIRTMYKKDEKKEIEHKNQGKRGSVKRKVPMKYVEILNEMGMNWDGVGARRRPADFRKKCQELQEFINKYGHSYVPKDWSENKSLAMWVERQRLLYRRKMEGRRTGFQLTDDRIEILQSLGFDFVGSISKSSNGNNIDETTGQLIEKREKGDTQNHVEKVWWKTLDYLRQYSTTEQSQHDMITEVETFYLSYWVTEQMRQFLILQNEFDKVRSRNLVTPKINFKCLLTPERYNSLVDTGFDFSMTKFNLPLDLLPWRDFADYNFDHTRMLDLMSIRKAETGSCTIFLDQNSIAKLILSNNATSDVYDSITLFLFQHRVRWEYRHQSIRSKIPDINWILEKEDVDVEGELNRIGFSWYEHDIPDIDDIWFREYEWWGHYYDLCRYKKANDDFALDPKGLWYSEDLVDWLEEQKHDYERFINSAERRQNDHTNTQFQRHFEEWHFQALYDLGIDFKSYEDSLFMQNATPVGRPPAIFVIENNLKDEYNSLSSDLKQVMQDSNNRKPIDKADQLAWLVRYEALRRLYSVHGPGGLSTLSTDKDVGDQRLILWVINQRKQFKNYLEGKKNALTPLRISLLNKINFDWEIKNDDDAWEEMIEALKKFKDEHGNCFVPAAYSKDIRLGQWVHLKRQMYQMSKREDKIIDLNLPSTLNSKKIKELIGIGLDLTMDNLSYGNIAFETVSASMKPNDIPISLKPLFIIYQYF